MSLHLTRSFFALVTFLLLAAFCVAQSADDKIGQQMIADGRFDEAARYYRNAVQIDPKDADAWMNLGKSLLNLSKTKDAVKAYQAAEKLRPKDDRVLSGLALAYYVAKDKKDTSTANKALVIDPNNAEAHYVLALAAYRQQKFKIAEHHLTRVVSLDPNSSAPYRLRVLTSFQLFLHDRGPGSPHHAHILSAGRSLERYVELMNARGKANPIDEELEAIKFFVVHYAIEDNRKMTDPNDPPDPSVEPLKILTKPHPSYTEKARSENVQGAVILLIVFRANGTIGPIIPVKRLAAGLTEAAAAAAVRIKFEPMKRNGVAVDAIRQVEYGFSVY